MRFHLSSPPSSPRVMAGLVPATHVLGAASKAWVPGTRPGMTPVMICSFHPRRESSIPKLHHRPPLRAAGGDADGAAVERRHEAGVGQLVADFLQERLDAEIDPAAEARIVMGG